MRRSREILGDYLAQRGINGAAPDPTALLKEARGVSIRAGYRAETALAVVASEVADRKKAEDRQTEKPRQKQVA